MVCCWLALLQLYMDVLEVLPGEDVDPAQFQPEGNRYDAQVVCLGRDVNSQLQQLRIFMVRFRSIFVVQKF